MTSKALLSHLNFYSELLKWWFDFQEEFHTERDQQNIVWNNKKIHIHNKPVFYKNVFEPDIIYVNDLLFHLNNTDSFNIISKKISRTNVLIWAGLRQSVSSHLKTTNCTSSTTRLSFRVDNKDFDALKKKNRKALFSNNSRFLKHDFNLTDDQLKEVFILPHNLAFEPYVKAFQYKILNFILYTNSKLYKVILPLINVLFVNQNQKRYLISSSIVCTPSFSGNILNPSILLLQRNSFTLLCKTY